MGYKLTYIDQHVQTSICEELKRNEYGDGNSPDDIHPGDR